VKVASSMDSFGRIAGGVHVLELHYSSIMRSAGGRAFSALAGVARRVG
jgi:hypothetical protein